MYLLIAGFASIGYVHGEAALRELSFDFEFVIVVFPVHTQLTIFLCLCCWQCKTKKTYLEKSVKRFTSFAMRLLSCFASSSSCCVLV